MNILLIGLGLILLGSYFNSLAAVFLGLLCMLIGLYVSRSRPVKEPGKSKPTEEQVRKTRHIVVATEPTSAPMMPWDTGEMPTSGVVKQRGFLPLPEYGYSDPLERIFFGFPVRFWKK